MLSGGAICSRCLNNSLSCLPASFALSRALNKTLEFNSALNLLSRDDENTFEKVQKEYTYVYFLWFTDCTNCLKKLTKRF